MTEPSQPDRQKHLRSIPEVADRNHDAITSTSEGWQESRDPIEPPVEPGEGFYPSGVRWSTVLGCWIWNRSD